MKTRHHRIPERAQLVAEKKGTACGHACTIRLWKDQTIHGEPRTWFYAYRADWRRAVVHAFTGRNLGEAQAFWDANITAIEN